MAKFNWFWRASKSLDNNQSDKKTAIAEVSDNEKSITQLVETIRAGLEVARFAVSNLHPEHIRNWPWEKLTAFAVGLETTPGLSYQEAEVSLVFKHFAQECRQLELERSLGVHKDREKRARGE